MQVEPHTSQSQVNESQVKRKVLILTTDANGFLLSAKALLRRDHSVFAVCYSISEKCASETKLKDSETRSLSVCSMQ